jgi:hypothetical protein
VRAVMGGLPLLDDDWWKIAAAFGHGGCPLYRR